MSRKNGPRDATRCTPMPCFQGNRGSQATRCNPMDPGFSEAEQEAAWGALSEAARAFEAADGSLCMDNQAYCVAARR